MASNVASFLKLTIREDTDLSPKVLKSLGEMGWEPVHGSYDFVYRWGADWEKNGKNVPQYSEEIKASVDAALRGHDVRYVFKTFQSTEKKEE